MSKIEKAITTLQEMQGGGEFAGLHPLCLLFVTLAYLVAMLSVPVAALAMLLWFALYPIIMAAVVGENFSQIFLKSLIALPFSLLIGLFNPIFQTQEAFSVGGVSVSLGWVTFISINLRAVLSVQALLILIGSAGFTGMCRELERIGVPSFLTTQLLMVYRYLTVLLQESLNMTRARRARGYGRKHLSLKMWGAFCGQLFLRTMNRADAIHRAMLARGFTGAMPRYAVRRQRWRVADTVTLVLSVAIFALMRFFDISHLVFGSLH